MSILRNLFHSKVDSKTETGYSGRQRSCNNSTVEFDNQRYMGRLYGFSWAIIETRDKSYNGEELKKQPVAIVAITATNFASKEESDVLMKLLELMDKSPKSENERNGILGALEGKQVVYKKMPCTLLLEENKIE